MTGLACPLPPSAGSLTAVSLCSGPLDNADVLSIWGRLSTNAMPNRQNGRSTFSEAFLVQSFCETLPVQCALPSPVPEQLVDTALSFLASGFDPARRNAAQFLAIALRVRSFLAEFDRQGGLARLVSVLRATHLLLGAPSAVDFRMDKQVG